MAKPKAGSARLSSDDVDPRSHLGSLLTTLDPGSRAALLALGRVKTVNEGAVLVEDGGGSAEVGYLLDGILGMTKRLPDGRVHIVGLLVPTDIYGRLFHDRSHYAIEALTEARVCVFERAAFEKLLRDDPSVERLFLTNILDELDAAREWLLLMSGTRVIERVAAFLMILARRVARDRSGSGTVTVHVPIPRSSLAHYLGTRPETLSRALHELADEGIVSLVDPYRIEILSLPQLTAAIGEDFVLDDIRHGT